MATAYFQVGMASQGSLLEQKKHTKDMRIEIRRFFQKEKIAFFMSFYSVKYIQFEIKPDHNLDMKKNTIEASTTNIVHQVLNFSKFDSNPKTVDP